jgi:hypothetical protein
MSNLRGDYFENLVIYYIPLTQRVLAIKIIPNHFIISTMGVSQLTVAVIGCGK